MPAPSLRSGWIDTDSDTVNDAWEDVTNSTTHSLSALDAMNLDVDGDGAYNSEELAYGSDPFDMDSDDDGLNDGDEIHLANEQAQKGYSLLMWDSNGDGVSDHDDFYGFTGVTYPGGVLPSFPNATYSDYDGDGIKNPFDPYPTDPTNNDADGDGITDDVDPAPGDSTNTSSTNGTSWYGSALEDADYDGIHNFWDSSPYDASNGSGDSDNDGIPNDSDPFPSDNSNYSFINGIYWYGDVLGDADWDNTPNYSDAWPYDANNGSGDSGGGSSNDDDGDGIENSLDPAPSDSSNYSYINNTYWYSYALEDADDDGTSNFFDPYPNDRYDNVFDYDGDGIDNGNDPYPEDSSNYSPTNGISWGEQVLGDDDGDGTPNWADTTPYPDPGATDSDGDGYTDDVDPSSSDPSNYSSYNGIHWYGDVFGNADGDASLNYWDPWPYDSTDGGASPNPDPNPNPDPDPYSDNDGDGLPYYTDPAPTDSSNTSPYNNISWYSNALNDDDNDGQPNFYDSQPYGDNNVDTDGDGYLDSNDPAVNDYHNFSHINGTYWYGDVFGDADGDGTANFYDDTPYGAPPPVDEDRDGLDAATEAAYGTSDNDPDSDDDGLTDYEEISIFGTSPTNKYYLSNERGWGDLYTDWQLVDLTDTDDDDIPDRIEQHYQLNPNWAGDARLDRDSNGLSNLDQYNAGMALDADLDRYDQDGDGMSDVFEDFYSPALSKTNPADAVLDADGDGVLNFEEMQLVLSPVNADTYGNGGPLGDLLTLMASVRYPTSEAPTADVNPANGIPDWADAALLNPAAPDHAYFTRQLSGDLDGDGMSDAWEHKYGRWKYQNGGLDLRSARDAGHDPDEDSLVNLTEFRFGTSPLAPATQTGTQDRNRFNRHGSPTPATTIPGGGGLMNRYRAQLAADLDLAPGHVESRAFRVPRGVRYSNDVSPFLRATVQHSSSTPGASRSYVSNLPLTLFRTKIKVPYYNDCSCADGSDPGPEIKLIPCSCREGKITCLDCNGSRLISCRSCDGDGIIGECECRGADLGIDENGNPIICSSCGGIPPPRVQHLYSYYWNYWTRAMFCM